MSTPALTSYPAEFKERAVKLAVESDQPIAQTARDLGVQENTFHTWIGKYHQVERKDTQVQEAPLYEALKRLRKAPPRWQEARESFTKAAAYFAPQLPCSTPGCSSRRSAVCVACVDSWRSRGVGTTRGFTAHRGRRRKRSRSSSRQSSTLVPRGGARMARGASSLCERKQAAW